MLDLNIQDEVSSLQSVILGTALDNGLTSKLSEVYDPKSRAHLLAKTYPKEEKLVAELDAVANVFHKYNVEVFRPQIIPNCNQIFVRDIGFVIEDYYFRANILPLRDKEVDAVREVLKQIDPRKTIQFPDNIHVEGGDVIVHKDFIFVGTYGSLDYPNLITARTNPDAVRELQNFFPHKKVKGFDLRKSNTDPYENILHLDCCFQPVGDRYAIIYPEGSTNSKDYEWLVNYFGEKNIFAVSKEEMVEMNCNIFSIAPDVVISDKYFDRLNSWLHLHKIKIEEVSYREISRLGGLLRCTTLPLVREK